MKKFKLLCKIDSYYYDEIVFYKNEYYICNECLDNREYYDIFTDKEKICLKYNDIFNFFYTDEEIRNLKLTKIYETNL